MHQNTLKELRDRTHEILKWTGEILGVKKYRRSTWGRKVGRKKEKEKAAKSEDAYKGHKESFYFVR